MAEVIDDAFGFTSDKVKSSDREGILLYSRAVRTINAAKSGTAGWVHSVAVKFNDPKSPALAALRFQNHMQELVDFITSDAAGSAKLDANDCKLTGGNPLATAFRRIHGAMEAGACLLEYDTSSKCAKFAREAAEKAKEERRMEAVRQELQLQGIDPTSQEGLALIQGMSPEKAAAQAAASEESQQEEDQFDQLGKEFAEKLRDLAQYNEQQALDMARSSLRKVEESAAKHALQQARALGLVSGSKSQYC